MTNSVLVGTMKFTRDQFYLFYPEGSTPPTRLADQTAAFQTAYDRLNAAYALTRESLITQDIAALDDEGDQLYLGLKETVEAARRMTYLPQRKQAGDRLQVFLKKYGIDVRENMISEWAKLQQLCEEAAQSAQVAADIATLGLTDLMTRLTAISDQLRQKLTERAASLPAQKAMKQAREAIYPEYRALIQVLNAYAVVDSDTTRFATLISALNNNIDYVRIHAMTGTGSTGSGSQDGGSSDGGSSDGGSSDGGSSGGGSSDGGSSDGGSSDGGSSDGGSSDGGSDSGSDDSGNE